MRVLGALLAALVCAIALALTAASGEEPGGSSQPPGFLALTEGAAAAFHLPDDVVLQKRFSLDAYGLTYERYQQYFGYAEVLGGEVTVYRSASGTVEYVIGAHYPDISPSNTAAVTAAAAARTAERDVGRASTRTTTLMIDPHTGRFFFRVESRSPDTRWFHWIDASNGRVVNRYDAIESGSGTGVKGDTKNLTGLTTFHAASGHGATGAHYDLFSNDNRQLTYDAQNRQSVLYYLTDSDDSWSLVTPDRKSPGQPAAVDAQYYANITDEYLQSAHGFNWLDHYPAGMQSVVHYKRDYDNAFWSGTYVIYGDGIGGVSREYSGGLDIVAHEHTHAVTEATSNLIYQDESGALNEAFSDMMGNSAEFFAAEPNSSNCVRAAGQATCADWWIAEDVVTSGDSVPGFRNMADPGEDADPDHYSERQIGGLDNGGVHTNSGIPNHAYYLLVNGGQNAGCDAIGSNGHTHTADCGVNVAAVGLAAAQQIFFLGFTALSSNATMCDARAATEAVAGADLTSVSDAWRAVGLNDAVCGLSGPTATPTPSWTATHTPATTATPTLTDTPTGTPTPTPCPDFDGDTVCDALDLDDDGDGCPDVKELQTDLGSEVTGGLRDPHNPWDYFNPTHDGLNRIDDVALVVAQFFIDQGNPLYTQNTDRTFAGPNGWNLGPPDGLQRVDDVFNQAAQFFHDCS